MRRRAFWIVYSLLLLVPFVAGCSYNPWEPTRWMDQQRLYLPHLQWAAGLSRLPEPGSRSGGLISSLAPFRRAGDGAQQLLVSMNKSLHVVGLDGSGDHRLDLSASCTNAAVTPDGRWVGCIAIKNEGGTVYQMADLRKSGAITSMHQVEVRDSTYYSSSAQWSPDGRYLAIDLDCDVAVFASSPPHASFREVARVRSSAFHNNFDCGAEIVAWSPDSAQLRLVNGNGTAAPAWVDVNIGPLLAGSSDATIINLPASDFHTPDMGIPVPVSGWYPPARMFLYLTRQENRESLNGVDPMTGEVHTLVTVGYPTYTITDYSWTIDGSQVLLAVGGRECVDCNAAYRSDVYLYTP